MEERFIVRRMDKTYPGFHQREVKLKLKHAPFPMAIKRWPLKTVLCIHVSWTVHWGSIHCKGLSSTYSINSLLNIETGCILLTKKYLERCFQKRSFSKRTGMFRALTTEKNGLELNDPLSNLLMAWNSVSFWSLVKRS